MSVSFYYDTMPKVNKFNSCYMCEMQSHKWKSLSDEQKTRVERAFSKAVLDEDDSNEVKNSLELVGRPECRDCKGKGWYYENSTEPTINWSNANASAVLSAMGYKGDELYSGDVSISDFRRAYIKALNKDVNIYSREKTIEYGKPREIEPGVVDLKPMRFMDSGLSGEDIKERLDRLGKFIAEAIENKATKIYWE